MKQVQELAKKIEVYYENGKRKIRCFCGATLNQTIIPHIKQTHPKEWEKWSRDFVRLRNKGIPANSIIQNYKTKAGNLLFTTSVVERAIRRIVEEQKAQLRILPKPKIDKWKPSSFSLQRTTVWDFRKRGEWAVHQNEYRGNWPPMVPRNLILKYTLEDEIILDPFVGGGTTLIEAWLNNRRSFGLDVSPTAIKIAHERIEEMEDKARKDERRKLNRELKPILIKGDARKVREIMSKQNIDDKTVKLACLHPPYMNALKYTETIPDDLSRISDKDLFCDQMQKVASQIYNLLTDDGTCAILIGDVKRSKRVIPLGFLVMQRFEQEDFRLKDIIIKIQHRDSSTRFWYTKREKIDYLMAHEYLFVFSR
jgi:DNA modification methylase